MVKCKYRKMRGEKIMKRTEHCRKIDASGRIIIPSQLRDELSIKAGDIHESSETTPEARSDDSHWRRLQFL
mgnify:CR=1 FL=1